MRTPHDPRIVAVTVTYNPYLPALEDLLKALSPQVVEIIVIDNGSSNKPAIMTTGARFANCRCFWLGSNTGIANAFNRGIIEARELAASHIALFDQDSLPEPEMIDKLYAATTELSRRGIKVAGVGARFVDDRMGNPPPFIRIRNLRLYRHVCRQGSIVPVDYLISSGCLISEHALCAVGMMDADLFIDYVDIEWGLRAKEKGYKSFGVCDATMKHALGSEPLALLGYKLPVRSPLRHYYMFRNAVWLYRQSWVPLMWKLVDGYRLMARYVVYSLFAKPRVQHMKMMSRGVWNGCRGKMGKYG